MSYNCCSVRLGRHFPSSFVLFSVSCLQPHNIVANCLQQFILAKYLRKMAHTHKQYYCW